MQGLGVGCWGLWALREFLLSGFFAAELQGDCCVNGSTPWGSAMVVNEQEHLATAPLSL